MTLLKTLLATLLQIQAGPFRLILNSTVCAQGIKRLAALTGLLLLAITSGCQQPPTPSCPYQPNNLAPANAGCLITRGDEVLVVTMRLTGKQSLPGGTSDNNEPPQCTARRETREETGLNVQVHELLEVMGNNFHVFNCQLSPPEQELNPKDWKEISDASWRSWLSLTKDNWRFPKMFLNTRKLIKSRITGISKDLD